MWHVASRDFYIQYNYFQSHYTSEQSRFTLQVTRKWPIETTHAGSLENDLLISQIIIYCKRGLNAVSAK